jgi:hypothetical protein
LGQNVVEVRGGGHDVALQGWGEESETVERGAREG